MSSEKNPTSEELYIEPNPSEEEIKEQIEIGEMVNEAIKKAEDNIIKINYEGTLVHKGFSKEDPKQKMVQYAYKLGGMDFVKLIECENGNWNIKAVGDSGKAFGLCQMNTNYHKLPAEYKESWVVQIEYCYKKWKSGTKFYGPSRIVKGKKCSSYVDSRFYLE